MATKFSNEQVDRMVGEYVAAVDTGADYSARNALIAELAEEFDVTVNAVRGKLVAEKVYVAKEATKASGKEKGTNKAEIVKAFEAVTGEKLASMEKMTKKDLQTLWDWVVLTSDRRDADNS